MPFILLYWKQILYAVTAAIVAGIIWWFGFHIPKKYEEEQLKNKKLQEQASIDKKTLTLQTDTQKEKDKINGIVQARLSSIHSSTIPKNSVLIKGGRVLH